MKVTNTGTVAGREVVIIKKGLLICFGKTRLLQPGESQTIHIGRVMGSWSVKKAL